MFGGSLLLILGLNTVQLAMFTYTVRPGSFASLTFHQITDDFWAWRLRQTPEFATSVGVPDFDEYLESYTLQAFSHRKIKCQEFLERIQSIEVDDLTLTEYRELWLLRYDLRTYIEGTRWGLYGYLNPVNFLEGLHKDYSYWLDAMAFDDEEGFRRYITRLRALATQINEQINLMREAVSIHWTNHKVSMDSVVEQVAGLVQKRPVVTPFYKPFNESLYYLRLSSNKVEKIRVEGASVIQDQVLPAYRKLKTFMQEEYLPATRHEVSVIGLPGGTEYYQSCLKWHLSYNDLSAQQIHQTGQDTVSKILAKINQIRQKVHFDGNVVQFLKHVHGANKFFFRTEDELLHGYNDIVYLQIPPKLPQFFINSQVTRLEVQPMSFDGPVGVMMPGSEDGLMPAVFFVNIKNPFKRPKWKMMSVALHETIPGRHIQVCYERNQSLPLHRRWREYRKMFAIPSQFPFYSAYIEGWALYAETLGRDMGLYSSPFDELGQLFSELQKACEMVVDTGIHALRWTKDEGVKYIVNKTGQPSSVVSKDVNRIITIPAHAITPEFGHLKIQQLRKKSQMRFGDQFDIKMFHHQVLKLGPVPLQVLEFEILKWIDDNAPSKTSCSFIKTTNLWIVLVTSYLSVYAGFC